MRLPAAVLALALVAPAAAAAEARIESVRVTLEVRRALVSWVLVDGFGAPLRDRIESGLPTGVVYELELFKDRKRWWDRSLAHAELQVVAMYNAVTREYLVNFKLDGRLIESRQVHDLAALEAAMTTVEGLPAFSLEGAPRDRRLLVRVRAELGSRTVLGFIPTLAVTEWAESGKFRPLPP
jgi:hypothetical protein